ncbi:hypothetical protein L249_8746, partial [Ophiocordyceps polyrhachis-furcata BCC 54312]
MKKRGVAVDDEKKPKKNPVSLLIPRLGEEGFVQRRRLLEDVTRRSRLMVMGMLEEPREAVSVALLIQVF